MRTNLIGDPRVGRIAMMCDQTETTVLGALFTLWAIADQHSEDGVLPHMSPDWLDRRVSVPGFSTTLASVGWLEIAQEPSGGVVVPSFDDHNGASAKRRASEASRKGRQRMSASDADTMRTPSGTRAEQSRASIEKSRKEQAAGEGAFSGTTACYVVEPKRMIRAMALLAESPVGLRQRGEATKLLHSIASRTDPCTFISTLIERAEDPSIVKKGGWMLVAMREEAKCV